MTPTMKLRCVFKDRVFQRNDNTPIIDQYMVLQQWWESPYEGEDGEWRDIPIEEEKP